MKKSTLYYIWLGAFMLCFLLSLIPKPSAPLQAVMTIFSLGFFVPPAYLLGMASQTRDEKGLKTLRRIAIAALALTLGFLVLNIMSAFWAEGFANFLYYVLVLVSVPAVCCKSWALSLFLWSCLLFATVVKPKK